MPNLPETQSNSTVLAEPQIISYRDILQQQNKELKEERKIALSNRHVPEVPQKQNFVNDDLSLPVDEEPTDSKVSNTEV